MKDDIIRPACYAHQGPDEWAAGCRQMLADLDRLARQDGCIAAAWALKVVEAYRAGPGTKFVLVSGDDGHWYVCPKDKQAEAAKYFEAVSDFWAPDRGEWEGDEPTRPEWLEDVGGAPSRVEFSNYAIR